MEKVLNNSYKILLHITSISASILIMYSLRDFFSDMVYMVGSYVLLTGLMFLMVLRKAKKSLNLNSKTDNPIDHDPNRKPITLTKKDQADRTGQEEKESDAEILNELLNDNSEKVMIGSVLSRISEKFDAVQGLYYHRRGSKMYLKATYAYVNNSNSIDIIDDSEGFIGASILSRKPVVLNKVPGDYIKAFSGLGNGLPGFLVFIPIIDKNDVIGVFELATFKRPTHDLRVLADHLSQYFSRVIISAEKSDLKKAV